MRQHQCENRVCVSVDVGSSTGDFNSGNTAAIAGASTGQPDPISTSSANGVGGDDLGQPCQTNVQCGGIVTGKICSRGFCRQCGDICQTVAQSGVADGVRDQLLALLAQAGTADQFNNVIGKGNVTGRIHDGRLNGEIGAVIVLDAATLGNAVKTLDFSAGNSAAQVQGGQDFDIPQVSSSTKGGQILVGGGGRLNAAGLEVSWNSSLTLSLQQGSKEIPTVAAFDRAILAGLLSVVGNGSTSVLSFQSVDVRPGAEIRIDGGVSLRGFSSNCSISISGTASGSGTAAQNSYASIESDQQFRSSGAITGKDGKINVAGTFDFSGPTIEPTLEIAPGAEVRFRQEGQQTVRAGNLTFDATVIGGHMGNGTNPPPRPHLRINATARDSGARVFFDSIDCPASAVVTVQLDAGLSRVDALRATNGVTIMSYTDVADPSILKSFQCDLNICDDAGCTIILNPNAPVAATNARRLLATTVEVSIATWSAGSVKAESKDVTQAAAGLSVGHGLIALTVLAVGALQRMF